ncbi:lactonase family protein [Streptomyces ochraceiscleroticus]|uniref:lactonase family protein n=1 Tax=Streptomyces ochraceiscleroticus TaxID=47761 RepID=UPI0004C9722F|nr:lactonase family protein [Streptomyces ochraceiscleroticus]
MNGESRNSAGWRAYIGSTAGGAGVVTAEVDPESGALKELHRTDAVTNPSYLAVSGDGRLLYAVSETPDGAAAAFSLTGDRPEPLAPPAPVHGSAPTHLTPHAGHLLTANYRSGSVSALPLRADGAPTEPGPGAVLQHHGSGPNPDRQTGPHAHAVVADLTGRWVLSVDLGTDSVRVCDIDPGSGELVMRREIALRAGSGPRHLRFHPGGRLAYVINELDPTVTTCRWDAVQGVLTPVGETAVLPEGGVTPTLPSEFVVSADGRFGWAANRGDDSIAVLALEQDGLSPRLVTTVPCGGTWPRDLALHPEGRHLYAANERSGDVTWFTVDPETGIPERAGSIPVPSASCVVFGNLRVRSDR